MARAVPIERWMAYVEDRKAGMGCLDAAKRNGITFGAAQAFDRGLPESSGHEVWLEICVGVEPFRTEAIKFAEKNMPFGKERMTAMQAAVKTSAPVGPRNDSARLSLGDFTLFRPRYMGRTATPWQAMAAETVVELLEDVDARFLCMNVFPGAGKSTLKHDICAWLTARDRALRGINGSRTETLAKQYTAWLRRTLDSPYPLPGALASMMEDFGTFKPPSREKWRDNEFIVYQADGRPIATKEPTWSSYGQDSSQHGPRADVIAWDDLVDPNKDLKSHTIEHQREFLDGTASTRLEPRRGTKRGGLFWLVGQRVGSDDVYRYALDKRTPPDDFEVMNQPEEHWPKKYVHITFPIHDEARCTGEHRDLKPWPESCLMDPVSFPWREVVGKRVDNPRLFAIQYQQEDVAPDSVLCNPDWLNFDTDRALWQPPKSNGISIITIDPSGTNFWGQQAWYYVPAGEQGLGGQRYLLDLKDAKGEAPDLLDWIEEEQRFVGLLEEWRKNFLTISKPLRYVVVEINAAQRYLLQYDHYKRWSLQYKIRTIKHTTGIMKTDPLLGIWSTQSNWEFRRVVLPAATLADRVASRPLVEQVTRWPGSYREDEVMAYWFMERNLRQMILGTKKDRDGVKREPRPSWMTDERVKRGLFNREAMSA